MYRTHNCGELRSEQIGAEVTLSGWVATVRDKGSLMWVDLRDRYGITQLLFEDDKSDKQVIDQARELGREFVIKATGKVQKRFSPNPDIPTGEIEIFVTSLEILNPSELPPFTVTDNTDGGEELRMKYRYLDLRRPEMTRRMEMRAQTVKAIREYLDGNNFVEIETPNLIKSTPEGARDFLVPSRLQNGKFYALPQSPQILKQLLMVSGMDRYYQVVKCYRDEDFRGDRQPEFSQIDCEMSFVHQDDVLNTFEGMTKHVFKKILDVELPKFIHLPYADAMRLYGTDKPDLRFDCKLIELNEHFNGTDFKVFQNAIDNNNLIGGVIAKGGAEMTRKQIDQWTNWVKDEKRGAGGMIYIKFNEDGSIKSSIDKFFTAEQLAAIGEKIGAEKGDILFIIVDKTSKTRKILGALRLELAKQLGWIDENAWSVFWVVDFPLFGEDEDTGEFTFLHHPFCMPNEADLQYMDTEPLKVRAQSYDLVINGNEIVSGSIRIHNREVQNRIFEILGLTPEEIDQKFGFMLDAFRYGAPPHGGCAFGLDRWVMLMAGGKTIRDVIAFPKNNAGRDLMMDAPSIVDEAQLEELGIRIIETAKAEN